MRRCLPHPSLHYQHALPTHKVQLHSKMPSQVVPHLDSLQNISVLFPKAIHASLNPMLLQKDPLLPFAGMVFAHATVSAVSAAAVTHSLPKFMLNELNNHQRSFFRHLGQFRYSLSNTLSVYNRMSKSRPFLCAMITAGCVLTLSDIIAQKSTMMYHNQDNQEYPINEQIEYDYRRTLALFTFGFFYYGIVGKGLYLVYDKILGPGRPLFKAAFDSTCHTTGLLIPSFYMITGTVKGQSLDESWDQLKREYKDACMFSVLYWVPLMFLTFRFCSQETRVLAVTGFSLIHKSVLSWFSNRDRMITVSYGKNNNNHNIAINGKDIKTMVTDSSNNNNNSNSNSNINNNIKNEEVNVKKGIFENSKDLLSKMASKYYYEITSEVNSEIALIL